MREDQVFIRYRPFSGETYEDTISPLTLVVHNHTLYVICFSRRAGDIRTLAMDHIVEASWLRNTPFAYPADYDPQDFLKEAFGITVGKPCAVELLVHQDIAVYFQERIWHFSQRLSEPQDGWMLVEMTVPLTAELNSWILSFGDKMKVKSPPELQARIRGMLEKAIAMYPKEKQDETPQAVNA